MMRASVSMLTNHGQEYRLTTPITIRVVGSHWEEDGLRLHLESEDIEWAGSLLITDLYEGEELTSDRVATETAGMLGDVYTSVQYSSVQARLRRRVTGYSHSINE